MTLLLPGCSPCRPQLICPDEARLNPGAAGYSYETISTRAHRLISLLYELDDGGNLYIVEIGVAGAHTSVQLLRTFDRLHMVLVDPYLYNKFTYTMPSRIADVLSPYAERTTLKLQKSARAASAIVNGSLDMVFIDGDHDYKGCRDDIRIWLPKVRSGGVLAGHDYGHSGYSYYAEGGVVRAVNEFIASSALQIYLDGENWWVYVD